MVLQLDPNKVCSSHLVAGLGRLHQSPLPVSLSWFVGETGSSEEPPASRLWPMARCGAVSRATAYSDTSYHLAGVTARSVSGCCIAVRGPSGQVASLSVMMRLVHGVRWCRPDPSDRKFLVIILPMEFSIYWRLMPWLIFSWNFFLKNNNTNS